GRGVHREDEERGPAGILHVVARPGWNRHQTAGPGAMLLVADAHERLAFDDVDDLIGVVLFRRPGVGAGRDRHHGRLRARGLVQHFEEPPAVPEHVDDVHRALLAGRRAAVTKFIVPHPRRCARRRDYSLDVMRRTVTRRFCASVRLRSSRMPRPMELMRGSSMPWATRKRRTDSTRRWLRPMLYGAPPAGSV